VKCIKITFQFLRILLFAFIFSVCMVLGIVPIIPKRKEQPEIEIKMEESDEKGTTNNESNAMDKHG